MVGEMAKGLPGNHQPPEQPTLMAPRLIELCFQTAGLWEMGAQNRFGLPQHVEQVSCFARRSWQKATCMPSLLPVPKTGRLMPKSWMRRGTATCI